jgi:hypothetical protein
MCPALLAPFLRGSAPNLPLETALSLLRKVRSRGCKSDNATLHVTQCSNLTNANPAGVGRSTTAGSQLESHTHTVEPCRILISGLAPMAHIPRWHGCGHTVFN